MSLKILLDMNLSPDWVEVFEQAGYSAVHWSSIGDPRAPGQELMVYARLNDYLIFTHDLDFGMLLALTQAQGPSVIQVRTQDVSPQHLAATVINTLKANLSQLEDGALVVIDEQRLRVRILPLGRDNS